MAKAAVVPRLLIGDNKNDENIKGKENCREIRPNSTQPAIKSTANLIEKKGAKNSWRSMDSSSDSDGESKNSMGLIETIAELQGQVRNMIEKQKREQALRE